MDKIRIGFPISITGKYSLQGKESLDGIKLWKSEINSEAGIFVDQYNKKLPVELIYFDDESSEEKCKEITVNLLKKEKIDLFLGPYSSGLSLAIAPITKSLNRIVWNYGGATDEITEKGYNNFINAITPSSHYFYGIIDYILKNNSKTKKIAIIYAKYSGFSTRVANGAKSYANRKSLLVESYPYESGTKDFLPIIDRVIKKNTDFILGVGRMDDDINLAKSILKTNKIDRNRVALVAASIDYFKQVFGNDVEGFLSTSQWEKDNKSKPDFGPTSEEFYNNYLKINKKEPNYLAAQAYNIGLIIEKCIKESGNMNENLLFDSANKLDTRTFYGHFRVDPATGSQIGHKMIVTKWERGKKISVYNG